MLTSLFAVLVVVGFMFWWIATWPRPWANSEFVARLCFFAAALLWGVGQFGVGGHLGAH